MKELLRIAIQKSGRLSEKSLQIIKSCGIRFGSDARLLKEEAENFPIEFLYLRDDDIPRYVYDQVADVGIVGRNEHDEQNLPLEILRDLGFAKCRLSIAVPSGTFYDGLPSLDGKRIATSYPNILSTILKKAAVTAKVLELSGSVEIAPSIGVADAICDLVSTGATLASNGLKEVEEIYNSSAVMVGRKNLEGAKRAILDRLLLRIDAVMKADDYKYVMFNLPKEHVGEIANIVGGMKSPTVTPLLDEQWCAVQTVVHEQQFWDVLEQLKALGAQGILVTAIEKMAD
ncbi:MAG: ATP phosphoribosyltransferase [Sphaerochaetaceae bacterium]|jgi:ATP phosphoribosyltransferase|nr:ATP phosphoribosyltransferase [Sphaerochaetaceae bacterium]NLO60919.1 ATP phosphoribosyltransferase [Spirochaetales bacterium]MDD2405340.1 ATP phosphoribosyltransferase [Sphaerochaetaceae bacterium]MDD3671127.1 ATP phosphoribosyltransferase [Sphaerochaetaceae bacterium]MDD4258278.1 ATP phosphoribosyltransferase [Sphaerochaetaceae bacterium]